MNTIAIPARTASREGLAGALDHEERRRISMRLGAGLIALLSPTPTPEAWDRAKAGSDIVVDAKSGVSGAGRSPGLASHFSEVNESVGAYSIGGHRHLPELTQELGKLSRNGGVRVTFVPHLVPMTRGILATCYFDLNGSLAELQDAYREFYAGQPFTRVVAQTPTTKLASHSNLCLVNVAAQEKKAVVTAALDNLLKGASGQGVECFNIAFGFDRTTALEGPAQWP